MAATDLGPTVPSVDPGQPFPADVDTTVNSTVDITVNDRPAEVINSIGWRGLVDTYRIDFRARAEAASRTAAIEISAAWIPSLPVNIIVR